MTNAKSVRKAFLDFFAGHQHEVVRSSPLVLANDPTLLFANAGMNQFKDVFTGRETRAYKRATSSQKCVRAGGKHNDLENVGFTARHHTFFEMLGNFSFGDYFKADAIEWAYTLVKDLGIDTSRLMYTVFGGDPSLQGVGPDDEARALWKKIAGVGDDRVLGLGAADNFWQMGDVGPMGPCSELHFFQGDDIPCAEVARGARCKGPACDCDRWMEIWNLVFMQYERKEKDGPLGKLPAPSVDTGAGLERMTAVVQGKRSNYDTDLFAPLLAHAAELAKKRYGAAGESGAADDASMRVIADHARAASFLIADGVFPEKTGREYVLRRIFRRAVRHGKRLGIEEPFMHLVCGTVVSEMGDVFPELVERRKTIESIALQEEQSFRKTLDRGLGLLEDEFTRMRATGEKIVPGAKVFQLYDTFGFPADLTAVIAAERGLGTDQEGFKTALAKAQQDARSEFKGQEQAISGAYLDLAQRCPPTEFIGYDEIAGQGRILEVVELAEAPGRVLIVTDRTPFYGASGGQVGDTGRIVAGSGGADAEVRVVDTIKPAGDVVIHLGEVVRGKLAKGQAVTLEVDAAQRDATRANHSATHLLHLALKRVLGDHAAQKGSLVGPDRLRFDFSHSAPMTDEEKRRVEDLVNAEIVRNADSETKVLGTAEAKQLGAVHMFGEKYGDKVRVVKIGNESLEFCGGTHVRRAGDIGLFKIVAETGIAQGVRRIEAVTRDNALAYVRRLEAELGKASERLRGTPFEVAARVDKLAAELRARDKEIAELKQKLATGGARDLMSEVKDIKGVKVLVTRTDESDPKEMRKVGDRLRDQIGSGIVVLCGVNEGKVIILSMVTKDLTERFHAGKIAAAAAEVVGGKGGGRPDMAQAGGNDPSKIDQALERVLEVLRA